MSRPSTLPMKMPPAASSQPGSAMSFRVAFTRGLPSSAPRRSRAARPAASRCRSAHGRAPHPSGRTARATPGCTRRWRRRRTGSSASCPAPGWGGDGRATPLDAAHAQQGAGHGGPGVAGADHGRGHAVADRLGGAHERRVLHGAHAGAGSASMAMTSQAGSTSRPAASPAPRGPTSRTARRARPRRAGAGHDDVRGVVATHGVDGDGEHQRDLTFRPGPAGMKGIRRVGQSTSMAGGRRTSRSCHLMWGCLAALQRGQNFARRGLELPGGGPAAAALGLGRLLLGDCHLGVCSLPAAGKTALCGARLVRARPTGHGPSIYRVPALLVRSPKTSRPPTGESRGTSPPRRQRRPPHPVVHEGVGHRTTAVGAAQRRNRQVEQDRVPGEGLGSTWSTSSG